VRIRQAIPRACAAEQNILRANVAYNRQKGINMDFMDERSTSPIDTITRRYAQILILKPFDSCPQICVYCQRNWEIKGLDEAEITKEKLNAALNWIENNLYITEVLVTGGDPLTLSNENLEWIIDRISKMNHIERIRMAPEHLSPCHTG
jgi:lysine 2,3-aminomutase